MAAQSVSENRRSGSPVSTTNLPGCRLAPLGAVRAVSESDVVFVDPDNGVETASVQVHQRNGPKYAYLEELGQLAGGERSLVVYHHLSRNGSAAEQIARVGSPEPGWTSI